MRTADSQSAALLDGCLRLHSAKPQDSPTNMIANLVGANRSIQRPQHVSKRGNSSDWS